MPAAWGACPQYKKLQEAKRGTCVQAGYSSVGRASDCRKLQQSDGRWFDSGWPDILKRLELQGPGRQAEDSGSRPCLAVRRRRGGLARRARSCRRQKTKAPPNTFRPFWISCVFLFLFWLGRCLAACRQRGGLARRARSCKRQSAGHVCEPAIAQLVEHLTVETCSYQMVPGSIPGGRTF